MYLDRLRTILTENNEKQLFPCIRDLVENGLRMESFTNEDSIPSRQDITQYLASWFKYIGISADDCQEWMIEYCVGILSAISSSSKSQIRHSTKSNIKYIYGSDVTFNCRCENNRFKATCLPSCPIYEEMSQRAKKTETIGIVESYETRVAHRISEEIVPIKRSVKDEYKDQFKKAIEVAQDHLRQGVSKNEIVNLLNDMGLKTRTGKKWSYSILGIELKKLNNNTDKAENEKM
jgi:hypothetical protein